MGCFRSRLAILSVVCLFGFFSVLTPLAQQAAVPFQPAGAAFVSDELLVQFKAGLTESRRVSARAGQRATLLRRFRTLDVEHLRLPPGLDPHAAARALRADSDVLAVQPNYLRQITASAPPNDLYWLKGLLWGIDRIGAQPAWMTYGGGNTTVIVANLDTGVDYLHPDLAANMWRNPGEIPGNGIDDDGNGYIDDVYGIDTVNRDSDPFDDHWHGTHTAGTAGAVANNHIGVVGVALNVRILACKFIDAAGFGPDAAAIECFNYVVDQKARGVNVRVTSNSWGRSRSGGVPTVLKNAIDAAGAAGILNVFAAGNLGTDNDVEPFDPASFTSPGIVAVAASMEDFPRDGRPSFSNYGATSVDLAAPGVNITSTFYDVVSQSRDYRASQGTSMATPHVAGAAALLFAHHPTLSVSDAKDALLSGVDRVGAWDGRLVSGGRLNVSRSLRMLGTNELPVAAITSPQAGASFTAPATIPLAAMATDSDGSVVRVDFHANGALVGSDTSGPFEVTWHNVASGTYSLTAVVTDNAGATTESAAITISVRPPAGSTPYSGTPVALPGTIQAENFDHGGAGIAYVDLSAGNSGGEYRATDVDIERTTDTGGGYNVGWMIAGEWLQYTVNATTAGTYTLEARVACSGGGGTFHVEVNGEDRTGPLRVPDTGGWQTWQTLTTTIRLDAGVQRLRVVLDANGPSGGVGNLNYLRILQGTPAAGSTPYSGTPIALPGSIEAENFDHGGAGIAYVDLTAGNSGGEYRATDVDIERTSDSGGGYSVGWMGAGEWLQYTVAVATAGTYKLEARVACNGAGGTFHVEVNGADRTGLLHIPNTGGWQNWQTVTTTIALDAGVQRLRVVLDANGTSGWVGNLNYLRLSAVTAPSPSASAPYSGTPIALPGTIQAEHFDHGGAGIAYVDLSAGNSGGEYRATDVDIERTTDTGGGYNVGWMIAGEWLQYTVNAATAGTYTLEARVACSGGGGTFHVEVNGEDRTGPLRVPDTGGWQTWQTLTTTIRLDAGVQRLRVVLDADGPSGGVGNLNYLRIAQASP